MRVGILKVLAIALTIVLVDIKIAGYEILPDIVGLPLLFFCAVLFVDRAGRFARTATVAALMVFLETVRLLGLAEAEAVVAVFAVVYVFLKVLLVITAADGVAQFCQFQGEGRVPRLCDMTGHVYALTFVCWICGGWFSDLSAVLTFTHYIITVFTLIMFFYFHAAILVAAPKGDLLFPEVEEEPEEEPVLDEDADTTELL